MCIANGVDGDLRSKLSECTGLGRGKTWIRNPRPFLYLKDLGDTAGQACKWHKPTMNSHVLQYITFRLKRVV